MVDRLWAGWRLPMIEADRGASDDEPPSGSTLFESILDSNQPDSETLVVERRTRVFVVMNRYPYSTGHVLVVPNRAVSDLEDLEPDEMHELWDTVRDAVVAVKKAFSPDGINVGLNLGDGAGPSVPDHVHVHVVPRWRADTNFMTALADVRVLPQTLVETWQALVEVWSSETES